MADITVIMDKLNSFETSIDLALFFQGYGIKAWPRNARLCPISKFVMAETDEEWSVSTRSHEIVIYDDADELQVMDRYEHSSAMVDFVDLYDRGYFPSLIEEGYKNPITGCHCTICS